MTYSTKTRSNTPPGCYHDRQTLSHWKTDRKHEDRRQKTEDRSQTMPCPELLPNVTRSCRWRRQSYAYSYARQSIVLAASTVLTSRQPLIQSWHTVLMYCDWYCIEQLYRRYYSNQLERCWFSYAASWSQSWVVLSVSKLETLLRGDVDFRSTKAVELLIANSLWTQVLITSCTVADARVVGICRCQFRCRNWRRYCVAMLTSPRQTKWKCWT
jgi:hypothetical protein